MTTCTMLVECGPLGEVELHISYRYTARLSATSNHHAEPASISIFSIKIGGPNGTEVFPSDDFIRDEIRPYCIQDFEEGCPTVLAGMRRAA